MKWSQKPLLAVLIGMAVGNVNASWSGAGIVKEVGVEASAIRSGVFLLHEHMSNPAGCVNSNYLELEQGNSLFDALYSMLLAARAGMKEVDVLVSDSSCTANNYPKIVSARLAPDAIGPASTVPDAGVRIARYTQNGTFEVPEGISTVYVTMCGGGGGGSGGNDSTWDSPGYSGHPGGGSWMLVRFPVQVTPGSSVPVIVGKGGDGGTKDSVSGYGTNAGAGGDGEDSSFGQLIVHGGKGGVSTISQTSDNGKDGESVRTNVSEGILTPAYIVPGSSGFMNESFIAVEPESGLQPCSGGGGGANGSSDWPAVVSPTNGAEGSSGIVMVEW